MRRSRQSKDKSLLIGICSHARGNLHRHIRKSLQPAVESAVHTAVGESIKRIQPVLDMLQQEPYKLMALSLAGGSTESNIRIRLYDGSVEQGELTFQVQHNKFHGVLENHLPNLRKCVNNSWDRHLQTQFSNDTRPMMLFGTAVGDEEFYDEYNRLIKYCQIIEAQYPQWIAQFSDVPEPLSVAAFYSSVMRGWFAKRGYATTTFMRRPRAPYTVAMSPELSLALTIALQLEGGNDDD